MDAESVPNSETGQTPETPDDATGDVEANKMASSAVATVEHELKIMEVEGAVSLPQQVDDMDIEADNVPTDMESENAGTEPVAEDAANISTHESNDPMGLLQRIDSNHEDNEDDDDDDDDDDSDDDASSASGSSVRRPTSAKRWLIWMRRWPWLLHEESDGDCAFCLYCNIFINVNHMHKVIKQHNLSLYHQDRENNYVAFVGSDEQIRSRKELKHEFGTDSYVAAMKQKRTNEVEALNNFNWLRWLNCHTWLERFQAAGTVGLCRVCNVRMNVEFAYLRKRHESSKVHLEAAKQYEKPLARKRKRSSDIMPVDYIKEEPLDSSAEDSRDPSEWVELIPDTVPQQCRCTLCNCFMFVTSFGRHLKTKVHASNLQTYQQQLITKQSRGIWEQYAELHSWLVADPEDPSMAYCSVCCKRFMYGHSEIKRWNHERSEKHQAALEAATSTAAEVATAGAADNDIDELQKSEPPESEEQTDSDDGSDEDYGRAKKKLTTAKGHPAELSADGQKSQPSLRHYTWKRHKKEGGHLCKICRVRFHNKANLKRHEQTARHKNWVIICKERKARRTAQRAGQGAAGAADETNQDELVDVDGVESPLAATKNDQSDNLSLKPVPASMQGRVMVWKERFPWLSYKRSDTRQNYAWCKLCETSIYLPTYKCASKHQRSSRHLSARTERRQAQQGAMQEGSAAASVNTATALTAGESKSKAAMAAWQANYSWLEPDATDESYCHCKICDTRVSLKVLFVRQHDNSRKHAENMLRQKPTTTVTASTEATGSTGSGNEKETPPAVDMDVEQDSDDGLSIKSETTVDRTDRVAKRSPRLNEIHRIMQSLRASSSSKRHERNQLDWFTDIICSSLDIASRLRTLERDSSLHAAASAAAASQAQPAAAAPKDTLDLFFESITQTMKTLPVYLVAEGKAKIMQIVCDLELCHMRGSAAAADDTQVEQPNHTPDAADAHDTTPESIASNISNKPVSQLNQPRRASGLSPPGNVNGNSRDVPLNIRRILPASVHVYPKPDSPETVRAVPIQKLTESTPTQNDKVRQGGHSTPMMQQ
ncbi:Su-var-3-7 [Drosophila busckii]|uniref:Su-var-3-7 n=1 Tax=Drosophila busckii TaxID=30019 RepID=A0A0M4EE69_DROBS|nr:Su-var-3-7 [Drosophila busckii]